MSVTTTGLDEFRRGVESLDTSVTNALKHVAEKHANAIAVDAKRRLRAQQKTSAHALADAIVVEPDVENNRYQVISFPPVGQPTNINLWNEFGTVKMQARPYMRPAADASRDAYTRDVEVAVTDAAKKALG